MSTLDELLHWADEGEVWEEKSRIDDLLSWTEEDKSTARPQRLKPWPSTMTRQDVEEMIKDRSDRQDFEQHDVESVGQALLMARTRPTTAADRDRYITQRMPGLGGAASAIETAQVYRAAKRDQAGKATSEDYMILGEHFARGLAEGEKGFARQVADIATAIPGFAIEFGATGGAYTGAKKATLAGAEKLLGKAAGTAAGKLAARAAARNVGVVAHTLANPQLIARETADQLANKLKLTTDDAGRLTAIIDSDDEGFAAALGKGALSAAIELGTERMGGALAKPFEWAWAKLPVPAKVRGLKAAVVGRYLAKPGSTVAKAESLLREGGWNGLLGESLEERAGEVARGLTGVSQDFGATGDIAAGRFGPAMRQLTAEAAAFAIPGLAKAGLNEAARWAGENPDVAKRLAESPKPSRSQWEEAGLPPALLENRTRFAEEVRKAIAEPKIEEAPPTGAPPAVAPPMPPKPTEEAEPFAEPLPAPIVEPEAQPVLSPREVLDQYEQEKGYDRIVSAGRKGYRSQFNQQKIAARDADVRYQELSAAAKKRGIREQTEATQEFRAEQRDEAVKKLDRGEIDKSVAVYTPLHLLPEELRAVIQEGARVRMDETKSPRFKAALQKIIDDAGKDTGAEVENQKAQIVEKFTGKRQGKTKFDEPWPIDPIARLFTDPVEDRAAMIDAAQESLRRGKPDELAQRVRRHIAESSGVAEGLDPEEVGQYLEIMRPKAMGQTQAEPRIPAEESETAELPLRSGGGTGTPSHLGMPVEMEGTGEQLGSATVADALERATGIPIRFGRLKGDVRGVYKQVWENARLKRGEEGSVDVQTHEIAHGIDQKTDLRKTAPIWAVGELKALDYEPDKARAKEGFAEFVRGYLTGDIDVATEAPQFLKHFKDWLAANPVWAKAVGDSKQVIDRYREAGAEGRVAGQISRTGEPIPAPLRERVWEMIQAGYQKFKDEARFGEVFEKELKSRGYKPGPGESFMDLYRAFMQAGPTLAHTAMESGVFTLGEQPRRIGPALWDVLKSISMADYEKWVAWAYARHARESWTKGKNPGITLEDANYVYEKYKGNADWEKAAQGLTDINNALVGLVADTGVIDQESAQAIVKGFETYLPLMRVVKGKRGRRTVSGKRLVNLPDPIHRRRGSGYQIIDPVQATVERMIIFYNRAAEQAVITEMIRAAEAHGANGWIEKLPPNLQTTTTSVREVWPNVKKVMEEAGFSQEDLERFESDSPKREEGKTALDDLINIYRPNYWDRSGEPVARVVLEGKPALYQFDPSLYDLVSAMAVWRMPKLIDATLGTLARTVRLGATGLNPTFAATNLVRDYQAYLVQREHGGAFDPAKAVLVYAYSEVQRRLGNAEDPIVKLHRQFAGRLSSPLAQDRKSVREAVKTAVRGRQRFGIAETIIDMIGVTEMGPRIAEFESILEKRGYPRARVGEMLERGELPPRVVLAEALRASHDVTVDFRRVGGWGKYVNRISVFWNARLEGIDKAVRTGKDNPARTLARVMTYVVAPSIVYWWFNHDKDWWKEREDWLANYWIFTDEKGAPVARVPRHQEWGQVGAGVEAVLDTLHTKDPQALKAWGKNFIQSQSPVPNVAGASVAHEYLANYDYFRQQPIESERLQALPPERRAMPWTSATMKGISQWLADSTGKTVRISPTKAEWLLNSVTGGMFRRVGSPIESWWKGDPLSPADIPIVQGFVFRSDHTASVNEFYTRADAAQQEYNAARLGKKRGEVQGQVVEENHRFTQIRGLMGKLRDLIEGEKDRDKRFSTERYIIGLARKTLGKPELDRYPDPFHFKDLPANVKDAVSAHVASTAWTVSSSVRVDVETQAAADYFRWLQVPADEAGLALRQKMLTGKRERPGSATVGAWVNRLRVRTGEIPRQDGAK